MVNLTFFLYYLLLSVFILIWKVCGTVVWNICFLREKTKKHKQTNKKEEGMCKSDQGRKINLNNSINQNFHDDVISSKRDTERIKMCGEIK